MTTKQQKTSERDTIESMSYEEADRWCTRYFATVTFISPTQVCVQAQGYKPVIGVGFREAVALAKRTMADFWAEQHAAGATRGKAQ